MPDAFMSVGEALAYRPKESAPPEEAGLDRFDKLVVGNLHVRVEVYIGAGRYRMRRIHKAMLAAAERIRVVTMQDEKVWSERQVAFEVRAELQRLQATLREALADPHTPKAQKQDKKDKGQDRLR